MSDDVPITDVFTDVEADPDAIIHAYGAESIDDLVEGPGDHDPVFDERIDGDVETAVDRLRDLADVRLEDAPETSADDGSAGGDSSRSVEAGGVDPTVEVLPGDGQSIEEFLGLAGPDASQTRARDGLVLVGPEPSPTRLSNDSFGGSTADPSPDAEMATTVFEWVS